MRFALVSHVLPPSWSGQAVMLYRLLHRLSPDNYCLISRQSYSPDSCPEEFSPRLPARYYHLPPELRVLPGSVPGSFPANSWLILMQRALRIFNIVKKERIDAIVACSGDLYDLPAGFMASRWAAIPFHAYMFDHYTYQWTIPSHRHFAERMERRLLAGASGIIVPNEFLRDEYRQNGGPEPLVIHNPCSEAHLESEGANEWPAVHGEIRIVYTGSVYHAHYDAFRNLVAAIGQLGRSDVTLHIYTAQSPKEIEKQGIAGPVEFHAHQPSSLVASVQNNADILFLPLAFDSPIPEVIRTSAPGKMGEYLASGRPILVHAPADSFLGWYFRQYECGVVVDRPDYRLLTEALAAMIHDAALRRSCSANARTRSLIDFDAVKSNRKLVTALGEQNRGEM